MTISQNVHHYYQFPLRLYPADEEANRRRIIAFLSTQDWPVTTEMIAEALRVSWNTARLHSFKLQAEGTLKRKRVVR